MKITKEMLLEEIKKRQGGAYNPNKVLVRDILAGLGIDNKRGWYLLGKLQPLYDWGVTIDLGWLTPEAFKPTTQSIKGLEDGGKK